MKPAADSVMAATYKLVQQAMSGQWQEVPKTMEERRVMLDRLAATASAQDQEWLGALRSAMAESDRAVAQMAAPTPAEAPQAQPGTCAPNALESTMERLARGR